MRTFTRPQVTLVCNYAGTVQRVGKYVFYSFIRSAILLCSMHSSQVSLTSTEFTALARMSVPGTARPGWLSYVHSLHQLLRLRFDNHIDHHHASMRYLLLAKFLVKRQPIKGLHEIQGVTLSTLSTLHRTLCESILSRSPHQTSSPDP